jgi:hypothetical protein
MRVEGERVRVREDRPRTFTMPTVSEIVPAQIAAAEAIELHA